MHITTKTGKKTPSSFIPFCEFGGDMTRVGRKIDDFDVPVCDSFEAKILNDQLCYEVDLNKFSNKANIKAELKLGFAFLLDHNLDRQMISRGKQITEIKGMNGLVRENSGHQNVTMYLNTLGKQRIMHCIYVVLCF